MKNTVLATCLLLSCLSPAIAGTDPVQVAVVNTNSPLRAKPLYTPPLINETYEYYTIRGNSEQELREQLLKHGCACENGRKYDSLTSWHWSWQHADSRQAPGCSPESFRLVLDITIRLPEWEKTADAPLFLVSKWDRYRANLLLHERTHRDHAIDAAGELTRAAAALPAALSCTDRGQALRVLGAELMSRLNADEQHFDTATNHGATQGAIFP